MLEIEGMFFEMVDKKTLLFVALILGFRSVCPFWEKGLVSPPTSIRTCSPRIHRLGRSGEDVCVVISDLRWGLGLRLGDGVVV